MFGRCDLCGGPGTTSHWCPGMQRPCRGCGLPGGADVTYICPALSRACSRCGAAGGADYTHLCPGPLGHPYVTISPPPTIICPQVVITYPTIVYPHVVETTYRVTCEAA